jgi:VIT1/CCC1 family predicted Fe2+/Mn2+ transporter
VEKAVIHERAGLLRDAVFSANDGVITTFAIVAGSAGAQLPSRVVAILGLVNLLADGISMATGNYLGVKSEIEYEDAKGDHGHDTDSPTKHGLVTFVTFIIIGFVPLIPYVFNLSSKLQFSSVLVGVCLFAIGAARSRTSKKGFVRSGIEVFVVGGIAAIVAYAVGFLAERYLL